MLVSEKPCELNVVLANSNFQFDNKHYLQGGGTAMGTKLAPSFANIFMGCFEDKFVYTYYKTPLFLRWYIDDTFVIWQYLPKSLKEFILHLNSCHAIIKFTKESSLSSVTVNFRDVTVTFNQNVHFY